ncbi:MAG: hypothetical protein IJ873_02400 [Lachnospiraceae bacterium]|nr:hypothetical protein [Lachnospiraceae bacterium]MBR2274903.1 hypothetical protein [Lachnospiraceae bacterium]
MKRKVLLAVTTVLLSAALVVPVFAANSSETTPVTADPAVAEEKGYTLTPEETAATATTLDESVQLSAGVSVEVSSVVSGNAGETLIETFAAPASIAEAKADLMKSTEVQAALAFLGIGTGQNTAVIAKSETLLWSDGAESVVRLEVSAEGIGANQDVAFLVYVPGEAKPRVIKPTRLANGKIRVQLPIPCTYHMVTNQGK